jgi:hypothetical protein
MRTKEALEKKEEEEKKEGTRGNDEGTAEG